MPDARVILNRQFLHADDDVEMTDTNVVFNRTLTGVENAESDANSLADLVTKEPTIKAALQKRREQGEQTKHQQTRSARSLHRLVGE
jgi:molybdopterin/thiamine biosynthesis adenylyltransferase